VAPDPWAGRRSPRAPIALFLATLLLAKGLATRWTHDHTEDGVAPEVTVEGGAVTEVLAG